MPTFDSEALAIKKAAKLPGLLTTALLNASGTSETLDGLVKKSNTVTTVTLTATATKVTGTASVDIELQTGDGEEENWQTEDTITLDEVGATGEVSYEVAGTQNDHVRLVTTFSGTGIIAARSTFIVSSVVS